MPNLKSAKKRLRRSSAQRMGNLPVRTRIRSARRAFQEAVSTGDKDATDKAFRVFCSSLDKGAKKGVIKKNTAIRSKTRAAACLRALSA